MFDTTRDLGTGGTARGADLHGASRGNRAVMTCGRDG